MPRSTFSGLVPAELLSRRRWKSEDARAILELVASSGLSIAGFAARAGVDAQRLYRWRALLSGRPRTPPAFIEIRPTSALGSAAIEVVLRGERVVRVRDGFNAETLRQVVVALDELGSRC